MTREKMAMAATCLTVVLGACATSTPAGLEGRPATYLQGYQDGCASGRASQFSISDRFTRSDKLFEGDPQYRQGWTDAYAKCADEQMQINARGSM